MYGAALSTVLGYGVGNVVLIPYMLSKKRMLSVKLKEGLRQLGKIWSVIKAGASQMSYLLMLILQY